MSENQKSIEVNVKDTASTHVLIQVIKTHASVKSLAKILLSEEQFISFEKIAAQEETNLLQAFLEANPNLKQ